MRFMRSLLILMQKSLESANIEILVIGRYDKSKALPPSSGYTMSNASVLY